jgi:hypothetical protein
VANGGLSEFVECESYDAATARAHSMNSRAVGPSVRFRSVTTATGGRTDNSIGNSLSGPLDI